MLQTASYTPKSQINMRLDRALLGKLDSYASLVGQSKTAIATQALEDYLDWRVPQTADLKKALASMDRGEFATDFEVEAVFKKYGA